MDIGGFSANLIVFFLFIYLFIFLSLLLNFFIYLFVPYKFWDIEVIFSIIIPFRLFSEKNDLLKIFFLIIVIFLDNKNTPEFE